MNMACTKWFFLLLMLISGTLSTETVNSKTSLKIFLNKEGTVRNLHDLWYFFLTVLHGENQQYKLEDTQVLLASEPLFQDKRGCIFDVWKFYIRRIGVKERTELTTSCEHHILESAQEECFPGCPILDSTPIWSQPLNWRVTAGSLEYKALAKRVDLGKEYKKTLQASNYDINAVKDKMLFMPGVDTCAIVNFCVQNQFCKDIGIKMNHSYHAKQNEKALTHQVAMCIAPELKKIAAMMAQRVFSKSDPTTTVRCFHAIHWRRGDKMPNCKGKLPRGRKVSNHVSCLGAKELIAFAKNLTPKAPIYVSTNEHSHSVRKELREAGLILFEDVITISKELDRKHHTADAVYALEMQMMLWACWMHQFMFPHNSLTQMMPFFRLSEDEICCPDRRCALPVKFDTPEWTLQPKQNP